MTEVIKLVNVSKSYNKKAVLCDINLTINSGDFIALTGYSGSGKTTLLNILGLIDSATSGDYIINGKNINEINEREKSSLRCNYFGYVFQQYNLIPGLTVLENLMLHYMYSNEKEDIKVYKKNVLSILRSMNLHDLEHQCCETLSGGEKQRVAFARVIISKPRVIIADEPTGNLDQANSQIIVDMLKELNLKYGYTIILVTHDSKIASIAKKIYSIKDKQIRLEV